MPAAAPLLGAPPRRARRRFAALLAGALLLAAVLGRPAQGFGAALLTRFAGVAPPPVAGRPRFDGRPRFAARAALPRLAAADAGDLKDTIASLEKQLVDARGARIAAEQAKKDAGKGGYLLVAADFERYRQSSNADLKVQRDVGERKTLRALVPFLENFAALQTAEDGPAQAHYNGIYQQLEKLEEDWGAVPFWPGVNEGDVPDLTTQTILERVPSEVPAGRVVGVREQGWKFRGEILRPAGVVVSAGPEQAAAAAPSAAEKEEEQQPAADAKAEEQPEAAAEKEEGTREPEVAAEGTREPEVAAEWEEVSREPEAEAAAEWEELSREPEAAAEREEGTREPAPAASPSEEGTREPAPAASQSEEGTREPAPAASQSEGPPSSAPQAYEAEMTRERPSWEVPTEAAETSASKEGAPKAEQTSAEGTPAVADILDELDQPSPSEEGTTDAAESASPAEDVTAEAEDAPSEEDKPEEAGGDDLLSSSAFLKAKQKVLEKELAEVVEATAAANAEQEAAAAEWEDQRVRLEKDFSNFRARQEDLKLEAQRGASVKVLEAFLTFLDNFDRARPIAPEESKEEYDNVYAALLRTLDEEIGLKKIPTVGEEFDYNLHNAIQQLPSDEYEENVIMSEMQSGFTLGGMVVRPAYVMVSAG